VFRGFLDNTGATQQVGIWHGSGGNYSLLVLTDDPAPGAGTGATFEEPLVPTRRAAFSPKAIGFQAMVNSTAGNALSLWSSANGILTKIAVQGQDAPGGQTYIALGGGNFFGADDGSIAYRGTAGNPGDVYGLTGIWLWQRGPLGSGTVSVVAKELDAVPDVAGATWNGLSLAAVGGGSDPIIYFFGGMDDPNPNGPGGGLYQAPLGQQPSAYVRYKDEAATGVPGALFNAIEALDVNATGDVAFRAQLRAKDPFAVPQPVDDTNDQGIYLNRTLILRKGTFDPASGRTFNGFDLDNLVINNAGQIAFRAGVANGPSGIYRRNADGTITVIAEIGQRAPGAPSDVTFSFFGTISEGVEEMNNLGQVVFFAHTSDGATGLWCNDPDGTLQLVVRKNAQIKVAEGDVRTVRLFGFAYDRANGSGTGGHDGRPKYINDSGQVVFEVEFTDGKTAIVEVGGSVEPPDEDDTAANLLASTTDLDPINTFTGELLEYEKLDLNLGGPMPLKFGRYYSSKLANGSGIASALGRNRLHNFDAKISVVSNDATIVLSDGRVIHFTLTNGKWTLAGRADVAFQLVQTGGEFLLADPRSQRMWTFEATGRLMKIEDGRGNSHVLHYDDAANPARLSRVTDDFGRTLALTYDAATGHLVKVRDAAADDPNPSVREANFTYTGENLATATDALGHTTTYNYDATGRLLSTQLPRGNTPFSQTYANGRVTTQTEHPTAAVTQTSSLAYDTAAHRTTITDPVAARVHTYTATGELAELKDEAGKRITFTSDETGRRSTATDQLGRTVRISYDAASGRPESVQAEDGSTTTFNYETRTVRGITFFDLAKITYADGTSRSFSYDEQGNLLSVIDQLGKKSSFTYDAHGELLTAENPTGGVATYTYDAATGNLATSKDSDTSETSYSYDAFSRLTRVTFPSVPPAGPAQIEITYDDADRVTTIADERGNAFTYTYDENDNVTVVTDPTTATIQLGHDALDRVVQITNRLGKTSSRNSIRATCSRPPRTSSDTLPRMRTTHGSG
jgi:YD repeat-containing protein